MVQVAEKRASSHKPTFKSTANRFSSNPPQRVRERIAPSIGSQSEKTLLANEIANELWSRLPISRLADEAGHRSIEQIIRVANSSYSQIMIRHSELRQWGIAICHATIEIHGDKEIKERSRNQLILDLKEQAVADDLFALPPKNFIDYKFADLAPSDAVDKAAYELEKLCLHLASGVFGLLERLQQHNIVGKLVNGESACQFTFFRRVAILEKWETEQYDRVRGSGNNFFPPVGATVDTIKTTSVSIQHRIAKHIHHVHNPMLRTVGKTKYPLPQEYLHLISTCPDWLRPALRILEGDLFREQQIEWDTSHEDRLDEQIVRTRKIPEPIDVPESKEWTSDPAITLGDYVITGWGEQAITGEKNRLRAKQVAAANVSSLATAKRYRIGMSVLSVVAVALMGLCTWATPLTASLAILTGIASMGMAAMSAHLNLRAKGRFSTLRVLSHGLLNGCSLFAVQSALFGILLGSLPALVLAPVFAVGAYVAHGLTLSTGELDRSGVN